MLDIDFGSACDDDLQPRSLCSCIGQDLQETWATFSIATLIKCVNDKDESFPGWRGREQMKSRKREPFIDSGVRFGSSRRWFAMMVRKGGKMVASLWMKVGRMFTGSLKFGSSLSRTNAPARWFRL